MWFLDVNNARSTANRLPTGERMEQMYKKWSFQTILQSTPRETFGVSYFKLSSKGWVHFIVNTAAYLCMYVQPICFPIKFDTDSCEQVCQPKVTTLSTRAIILYWNFQNNPKFWKPVEFGIFCLFLIYRLLTDSGKADRIQFGTTRHDSTGIVTGSQSFCLLIFLS